MERDFSNPGQAIKFFDENRQPHDAIVTIFHGMSCINLVYVSGDEMKSDVYGRQIERRSSVCHKSQNNFGNYWCWPDEV